MATMKINNQGYVGQSITIINGKIIIDSVDVTPDSKVINIQVEGNVSEIKADACDIINVTGNVGRVETVSGDVTCGNVETFVQTTSGDVRCGDVNHFVKTVSGDVQAKTVHGSVNTVSGDIN